MTNHIQVTLEIGPKGKKVVAVAPDWPGLERGATARETAPGKKAVERLLVYVPRYATVTKLAERKDGQFHLEVTVPCNCSAVVVMSNGEMHQVESGKHAFDIPDLFRSENTQQTLEQS